MRNVRGCLYKIFINTGFSTQYKEHFIEKTLSHKIMKKVEYSSPEYVLKSAHGTQWRRGERLVREKCTSEMAVIL